MSDFGKVMEEKCMNFAIRVVNMCRFLNSEKREYRVITDQLFRSGTSIGANFSESQCAISRNDFVSKLYISLKECNETLYWIELLYRTHSLTQQQYESIYQDCLELKRMLTSITHTIKEGRTTKPSTPPEQEE